MSPLSDRVSTMMLIATVSSVASSAHAIPLSAGSLALRDAATPAVETVQWRGWGGWRGGWGWGGWRGAWGWGGLGIGLTALAAAPYYSGYYSPYYSSYYYSPAYYGYYVPTYYGAYGYYGDYAYSPYYGYGWSHPRIWYNLGHRRVSIRR
jgi:hypothetical protein